MEITQIVPDGGETGKPIQIFGSNFGSNQDTIWFGDLQIRGDDVKWADDRIDLKVPMTITEAKKYSVKIAKGGFLSDEKVFTVTKITVAPTVVSMMPNNGSSGVAVATSVMATFSQPVDRSTVNANTFTLKDDSNNTIVNGIVFLSPDSKTATFKPSSNLQSSTPYTVTITTGVKDLAGNAMSIAKT